MGVAESSDFRWACENVLFLDPDAPPFVDAATWERNQRAKGIDVDAAGGASSRSGHRKTRRRVQRHVPSANIARARSFRVVVEVGGLQQEFVVLCCIDPPCIQLQDRTGRTLRQLPASLLKQVQQRAQSFTLVFRSRSSEGEETSLVRLRFFDQAEADLFADYLRLMFGVFVEVFGITRGDAEAAAAEPTDSNAGGGRQCPTHGFLPCQCAFRGSAAVPQDIPVSAEFPVAIRGALQVGATVQWEELSPEGASTPAVAAEWRVSSVPGGEADFGTPGLLSRTLRITEDMVGCKLRLQVARPSRNKDMAISQAVSPPITLDSSGARAVLELLGAPNSVFHAEWLASDAYVIFPEALSVLVATAEQRPFANMTLRVSRESLTFAMADLQREIGIKECWMSRKIAAQSAIGQAESTFLQVHFWRELQDGSWEEVWVRLALDSEQDRNQVYHTFWFLRLSPSFKGFHRWATDLATGNYSVLAQRYAKLWGAAVDVPASCNGVPGLGCRNQPELQVLEGRQAEPKKSQPAGGTVVDERYAGEYEDDFEEEVAEEPDDDDDDSELGDDA